MRSSLYPVTILVTVLVSFTGTGFPQTVFETYLESEEEISQAYYGGELTHEQYQDLLDCTSTR